MKIDVSEVKSYRICPRQHNLTSRNRMHLRPIVTPDAFVTGKLFHKALHSMYLGATLESIIKGLRDENAELCLYTMLNSYYINVLPLDLDQYAILDIEHRFTFKAPVKQFDIDVVGSIDMLAQDKLTGLVYGFEHKSAKNFKDATYMWMDEQPRLYTEALRRYCIDRNLPMGGIFINEVRKLTRDFSHRRTLCEYSAEDLDNFLLQFYQTASEIYCVSGRMADVPKPSFMGCQMCDFAAVCQTYKYATLDKDAIMAEFDMEFKVAEMDHLEEDKGGA